VTVATPATSAPVVPAPTPEAERDRLAEATRRAFVAESAARQRDPHHFGLSSLGGCRRRAAYTIARTPVSDPDLPVREGRAANPAPMNTPGCCRGWPSSCPAPKSR
jgi:hypothetical protein